MTDPRSSVLVNLVKPTSPRNPAPAPTAPEATRAERARRKPRRRRFWRRLRRTVLLVALTLAVALYVVTRPAQLKRIGEFALERITGLEASVASVAWNWRGRIDLDEVVLKAPGQVPGADRVFDAEHVQVNADLSRIWRGRVGLKSIVLLQPTLHVTEDVETGRFNLQWTEEDDEPNRPIKLPVRLPEVFIRNGGFEFAEVRGGKFEPVGSLEIEGTLTEEPTQHGRYNFVLRQESAELPLTEQPVLRGEVQLEDFEVRAVLEHFGIDHPQRNLLPRRMREWWDHLAPQGELPTIEVAYSADPGIGLQATIALARGEITLPYGEFGTRMTEVSGRFRIDHETIHIEDLTGLVEGIRYDIDGSIDGFGADAAFDMRARTDVFTLEENPQYLTFLPPNIRKHYDRFSPSGQFRVQAQSTRTERGGPISGQGRLEVLGAKGSYFKFPYPIEEVYGVIAFSEERVELLNLAGRSPTGGAITINGVIAPPGKGAAVDVNVTARGVALDGLVTDAMEPKHRKVIELFLNPLEYARLIERGLVRPSDPASLHGSIAINPEAPVFDMGGRIDADIAIRRAFGPDQKTDVTTVIETKGAGMLFEHWPYPLTSAGGKLTIAPDYVAIEGVQARGLSGGSGVVDGRVHRPAVGTDAEGRTQRDLIPEIALREVRLPADELLLASIPDQQADWIRKLGLAGTLLADGQVFEREDGKIDFRLHGRLTDMTATPIGEQAVLGGFVGGFDLTRASLKLDKITGVSQRTGEDATTVSVSGDLGWGSGDLTGDVRLSGTNLDLTPRLVDILPDDNEARRQVLRLFDEYRPTGRFDAELDYRTRSLRGTGGDHFTLTMQPRVLAFDWGGGRAAFEQMAGVAVVRPQGVELGELRGTHPRGVITIGGQYPFGPEAEPRLRLRASGNGLDDTLRALVPGGVVRAIEGLEFAGTYELNGSLIGRAARSAGASASPADKARELAFDAVVELSEASVEVGVAVRDLEGTLQVAALKRSDADWPLIDLRLDADHARISDRLVSPLTMWMATGDEPDVLELREMIGSVYAGTVVGKGAVQLSEPNTWRFDLALQDVDLEPFLNPLGATDENAPSGPGIAATPIPGGGEPSTAAREPQERRSVAPASTGKISASLAIEAEPEKPQTRRGRGDLEVRDASMVQRPLAMAVFQAASLSLPTGRSFDRAEARYQIVGDTVHFDNVELESPSVAIIGQGTMDFPTLELDLQMVTRNPAAPTIGPINDIFNMFKDELIAIRVTGPLGEPKARVVSFEAIRGSIGSLLGAKREEAKGSAVTSEPR